MLMLHAGEHVTGVPQPRELPELEDFTCQKIAYSCKSLIREWKMENGKWQMVPDPSFVYLEYWLSLCGCADH